MPVPKKALRVLLAEDTPANQQIVTGALRKRGHTVTIVENGQQAIEIWKSGGFDAVLMDVQMPALDGYQATAAIRALEEEPESRTPIIALTAHAMSSVSQRCLAAGMDAYLAKPIDVKKLVELVELLGAGQVVGERFRELPSEGSRTSTGSNNSPVMDYRAALRRLGGDEELFRQFIEVFDEDAPRLLGTVRLAYSEGNEESLQRAAHSLRGLAANFDAHQVVDIAKRLETGQWQSLDDVAGIVSELERVLACLHTALDVYRPGAPPSTGDAGAVTVRTT